MLGILLLLTLIGFISLDAQTLFSLQTLKQYNADIQEYISYSPVQSGLLFVTLYMIATGLSVPVGCATWW